MKDEDLPLARAAVTMVRTVSNIKAEASRLNALARELEQFDPRTVTLGQLVIAADRHGFEFNPQFVRRPPAVQKRSARRKGKR